MTVCPLCKTSDHPIRVSHVIPDAAFRRAKTNGKMMKVDFSNKTNELAQDSWSAQMLCSKCEHHFNQVFEDQTLNELRQARRKIGELGFLKLKTKNPKRLAGFMLSLVWRAAQSDHWAYQKIQLPRSAIDGFGEYLLSGKSPDLLWKLSYRITAMYDSQGIFDVDAISRIIASPCLSRLSEQTFSFVFMFEGYKFEVITNSDEYLFDQVGVVKSNKAKYNLPRQCIWSDSTFGKTYREMYELAQSNRVKDD